MKKIVWSLIVGVFIMGAYALAQDTTVHSNGLTVNGTVESTSGGVIFPDGSLQSSAAHSDFAEYCLEFHLTEDENGPIDATGLLKIALTKTGGDYYTVQGIVPDTGPGDRPVIFSGSAVLFGSELYINFSSSQEHGDSPWRDTGVGQMRLDPNTMNGNFWSVRSDFETSQRIFDTAYSGGTVTLISCP